MAKTTTHNRLTRLEAAVGSNTPIEVQVYRLLIKFCTMRILVLTDDRRLVLGPDMVEEHPAYGAAVTLADAWNRAKNPSTIRI